MYNYDFAVFIGRFQPFHSGHHHVVQEALKQAERVIIVVGSSERPNDSRNPFSFKNRCEIIYSALHEEMDRIKIVPQIDYTYNDEKWIASIQASVNSVKSLYGWKDKTKIAIIGYDKDHSSYYLKKFPIWDLLEVAPINNFNATEIRHDLFYINSKVEIGYAGKYYVSQMHKDTVINLAKEHPNVCKEFDFIENYKQQWKKTPYPVIFNTVDAVVTQSGHILLVERGAMPGEGLWALPGGFINQSEKLLEAVIRELYEETKIDVPKPVLVGSIVKTNTYDDPYRSTRGRTISQAYHFKLADREELPKIKGSDDAVKAKWVPFSAFMGMRTEMFEDHFSIVEHMLGL